MENDNKKSVAPSVTCTFVACFAYSFYCTLASNSFLTEVDYEYTVENITILPGYGFNAAPDVTCTCPFLLDHVVICDRELFTDNELCEACTLGNLLTYIRTLI